MADFPLPVVCTNCKRSYPSDSLPFVCPVCGGLYDFGEGLHYPARLYSAAPGIWRYREAFGLPAGSPEVSLGEGGTALILNEAFGKSVGFKLETQNPTGAFKDRGSAVLASFLKSRGVDSVVEDSSGNAGASLAAYAARAGIRARLFIPDSASGPKRAQIAGYGAELVRIMGPRSNAASAVKGAAEKGAVYASHVYLPYHLAGYATAAYEIVEQLGEAPGAVVLPCGHGGLLLGLGRGFKALREAGKIDRLPRLFGVQAQNCAPLWALWSYGPSGLSMVTEGATLAEGIRVLHPTRGDAVLQIVAESEGGFLVVDEAEIVEGRKELFKLGFSVEPTSAVVWPALQQLIQGQVDGRIVAVLTGSGYKTRAG